MRNASHAARPKLNPTRERLLTSYVGVFAALTCALLCACEAEVLTDGDAEGSENEPAWVEVAEDTLGTCEVTSCADRTIWGNVDDSAARCALNALSSAQGMSQTYPSWADGGGWCGSTTDVVIHGDGIAYVLTKSDGVCDENKVFDSFRLQRCELKEPAFFEACIEELDAPDAPQGGFFTCWYDEWFTGCEDVEVATCG